MKELWSQLTEHIEKTKYCSEWFLQYQYWDFIGNYEFFKGTIKTPTLPFITDKK